MIISALEFEMAIPSETSLSRHFLKVETQEYWKLSGSPCLSG